MRNLVIFGAGGFGREVALMIRQLNQAQPTWNLIGFYDDGKTKGDKVDGVTILGGIEELKNINELLHVVVGIADPELRMKIVTSLEGLQHIQFPVVIHPTAITGDTNVNRFGRGTLITAGCILTTAVTLGDFVILNLAVTVGHDVNIQSFASVMPGGKISGFVNVGAASYIGTGAIILPHVALGESCVVGAGAVVTKSVESRVRVMGVPAAPK